MDIKKYLACWLDLMGQQELLDQDFKKAITILMDFRHTIQIIKKTAEKTNQECVDLNKKAFPHEDITKIIYHDTFYIGDSAILIIPMPENNNYSAIDSFLMSIYFLLTSVSINFMLSICKGYIFRGAIAIGDCVEIDFVGMKDIYGTAIVKAYYLEDNKAQYPRIILDEQFINYLNAIKKIRFEINDDKQAINNILEKLWSLIERDEDNLYVINYLSELLLKGNIITKENISSAINCIKEFKNNYPKYIETYAKMENYFSQHGYSF